MEICRLVGVGCVKIQEMYRVQELRGMGCNFSVVIIDTSDTVL